MDIKRFSVGTKFEQTTGAATAVAYGDLVYVSGVYPVDDFGTAYTDPDIYKQALRCAQTLVKLAEQMHLTHPEFLRLRVFVTNDIEIERLHKALFDFFAEYQPCLSIVYVAAHIHPGVKIMMEADLTDAVF